MKLTHLLCGTMLGLTAILTGCTSMQSQSTHIPQNIQQQLNTKQPIISYFSKTPNEQDCGCASTVDQTYSLKPIEDGYYRTLLGRDKEGRFLVQDFFQKTQKPQSSPIWIQDPMGLLSFENKYVSGPVTLYFENGNVSFQGTLEQGEEVGKSQSYYKNGKLGLESEIVEGETVKQKLWYSTGAKAADFSVSDDASIQVTDNKVWNKEVQLVEDEAQQSEIVESIYNELNADRE